MRRFTTFSAAVAALFLGGAVFGQEVPKEKQPVPAQPNQGQTPVPPGQPGTTPGGTVTPDQPGGPVTPGQPGQPGTTGQPGAPTTGGQVDAETRSLIERIHTVNGKEIRLGELARTNGTSEEVKKFGERLVTDHRQNDQQLIEIARRKGIELKSHDVLPGAGTLGGPTGTPGNPGVGGTPGTTVPAGSKPEATPGATPGGSVGGSVGVGADVNDPVYTKLQGLKGEEFDRQFTKLLAEEHEKVIDELKAVRDRIQDREIKEFVQKTIPALHEHHQLARKAQNAVDGKGGDRNKDKKDRKDDKGGRGDGRGDGTGRGHEEHGDDKAKSRR